MTDDQNIHKPNNGVSSIARGTIFNLEIVILVAFILATFFAAWTPGLDLSPNTLDVPQAESQPDPNSISQQEQSLPEATLQVIGPTPVLEDGKTLGLVVGHWGDENDPGAVCPDLQFTELKVNQNIASLVEKELAQLGYNVVLLKEFDPKLFGFKALAMVSLHADSCNYINDQATGYKVAAAMGKENQDKSTRLAACLRSRYGQATGLSLHSTSMTPDMTSYHAFGEIDADTPAVIIETGFLNLDRQFLSEQPGLAAKGVIDGILCFLNNESISPTPLQPTP